MKKALLVTTVSGFIPQFEMENVHILEAMGYEIHYATNYKMPSYGYDNRRLDGTGIVRHQIDFARSPFAKANYLAYKQLKQLMINTHFDLVHCHTPMGGVLARIAAHKTKTCPILYTAHGFHFFRGAPLLNWVLYYPVERFLSRYTDMQITINEEDYHRAQTFHAKAVRRIHGVGIQTLHEDTLVEQARLDIRGQMKLPKDATVLISAGELNKNKNQRLVLEAMHQINKTIYYLICGKGPEQKKLEKLCEKYGLTDRVRFLGYRTDLCTLMQASDVLVMPSKREGLPTVVMEAMTYGLPIIGTNIRGNNELIIDGVTGFLVPVNQPDRMAERMIQLTTNRKLREKMGNANLQQVKLYSLETVRAEMYQNYKDAIEGLL